VHGGARPGALVGIQQEQGVSWVQLRPAGSL